jgi:hypothetical protein
LHKKEATRFAQDATLLFSLFLLTSFELLCIGETHNLFGIFVFLCFKTYFFYLCMSHNGFFSFLYLSHRACFGALLNFTHKHKPSHGRDTCAMLRNTRKATLNGIGTQRKKRAYKVGASYTYAKVRPCQNTRLVVMLMKVMSND